MSVTLRCFGSSLNVADRVHSLSHGLGSSTLRAVRFKASTLGQRCSSVKILCWEAVVLAPPFHRPPSRPGPFVPRPVPGGTLLCLGPLCPGPSHEGRFGPWKTLVVVLGHAPVSGARQVGARAPARPGPQRDQRLRVGFPGGIRSQRSFRWSGGSSVVVRG